MGLWMTCCAGVDIGRDFFLRTSLPTLSESYRVAQGPEHITAREVYSFASLDMALHSSQSKPPGDSSGNSEFLQTRIRTESEKELLVVFAKLAVRSLSNENLHELSCYLNGHPEVILADHANMLKGIFQDQIHIALGPLVAAQGQLARQGIHMITNSQASGPSQQGALENLDPEYPVAPGNSSMKKGAGRGVNNHDIIRFEGYRRSPPKVSFGGDRTVLLKPQNRTKSHSSDLGTPRKDSTVPGGALVGTASSETSASSPLLQLRESRERLLTRARRSRSSSSKWSI